MTSAAPIAAFAAPQFAAAPQACPASGTDFLALLESSFESASESDALASALPASSSRASLGPNADLETGLPHGNAGTGSDATALPSILPDDPQSTLPAFLGTKSGLHAGQANAGSAADGTALSSLLASVPRPAAQPAPAPKSGSRSERGKAEAGVSAAMLPFPLGSVPAGAVRETPKSPASPIPPDAVGPAQLPVPQTGDEPRVEILRQPTRPVGERAFHLQLGANPSQPGPGIPASAAQAVKMVQPSAASADAAGSGPDDTPSQPAARAAEKREAPASVDINPASFTAAPAPVAPQPVAAPAHPAQTPRAAATSAQEAVAPEIAPQTPSAPAQHIALRVSTADDRLVDVRLVSRAGDVHVSVHTPDEALAHAMRTELGSLTGKLSQAGFSVQTAAPSREDTASNFGRRDGAANQGDSRNPQEGGRQSQQQQDRERRAAWFFQDEEPEE